MKMERYGMWVWHDDEFEYECTACGCRFDYYRTNGIFDRHFEYANFCPYCGAKMLQGHVEG